MTDRFLLWLATCNEMVACALIFAFAWTCIGVGLVAVVGLVEVIL